MLAVLSVSKAAVLDTREEWEMSEAALCVAGTQPEPPTELDTRREWLTEHEVEQLIKAARTERDRLMILMAYRHGLRVSELISLT